MPKIAKELSAIDVKRITKPGRHAVGYIAGLLLVVKESGAKSWQIRTVIGKKRRSIGLGGYPEIPLAEAREKAREIKKLIDQGIDPIEQKQARRATLIKTQTEKLTFAEATHLCHQKKQTEFKNEKHAKQWISTVEQYANPILGNLPVADIDLPHILKVLEPIWTGKTETASRLRQRIEAILSWATVSGYRKGDNPARWKGHLDAVLPKPGKVKKTKHHQALPWQQIAAFIQKLKKREGISARCLEFMIFTACKSQEARLAVWDEFDLENKVWTIPADRMKAEKEHKVPLTDDMINLLENLPRFEGSPYVFPAARGGSLSDMAPNMVCRRMKIKGVPHGFRSTFRDWAAENTNFPREVIEMALAHAIESKVEAAYRRGDLFAKRRKLMDAWASFCNQVRSEALDNVTSIRRIMSK